MSRRWLPLGTAYLALALLPCSCATAPTGGVWGESSDWLPGLDRIGGAAHDAFAHPWTWVPALGALTIGLADVDHDISVWATEETPVFGSQQDALQASNDIKKGVADVARLSILATYSGGEPWPWVERKTIGFASYFLSKALQSQTVDALKESTSRMRYDGSDERSFPSQHTSSAFLSASWTNSNIDYIPVHGGVRRAFKWVNLAGASAVAWARVEGGKHYLSDVLIGAALGNAAAVFFQRALVGVPEPGEPEIQLSVSPDGEVGFGLRWSF